MSYKIVHKIWSWDIDLEDWEDFLKEEHPDVDDEYEQYLLCAELNDSYFDDELANLNVEMGREFICIGDLGLWDGRHHGYREVKGTNLSDCLRQPVEDRATWYVDDNGDLCCKDCHHDGTNYYMYRMFKPNVTYCQRENFKEKLASGRATRKDILRLTDRLGDAIAEVYGIKIRKLPKRRKAA